MVWVFIESLKTMQFVYRGCSKVLGQTCHLPPCSPNHRVCLFSSIFSLCEWQRTYDLVTPGYTWETRLGSVYPLLGLRLTCYSSWRCPDHWEVFCFTQFENNSSLVPFTDVHLNWHCRYNAYLAKMPFSCARVKGKPLPLCSFIHLFIVFFYLACQRWKGKSSILLFLLYFSCASDAPIDFSLVDTHSEVSSMFTWVYMYLHSIYCFFLNISSIYWYVEVLL